MNQLFSKTKIFTFFTIFLVIIIPLTVAEIYCRLTRPHLDINELTGKKPTKIGEEWKINDAFCAYKGKPGYVYELDSRKGTKTINEHGFISTPPISPKKDPGTIRIAFLGESSTAGIGYMLSDQHTWPQLTINILRAQFPHIKFDFINASMGGFSSFESYGRLWSRIRFFSPNIIIVYHGWNEFYYFNQVDTLYKWRTDQEGNWDARPLTKKTLIPPIPLLDSLMGFSQFFTHIRYFFAYERLTGQEKPPSTSPDLKLKNSYDPRALEVWRTNLRLIKNTAQMMNAKLFICKQATLVVKDLDPRLQQYCGYWFHGFDHDAHVRAFNDLYRVIDQEFEKSDIIDVTPLSGTPIYFGDHIHPTEIGSLKIAQIISHDIALWMIKQAKGQ